MGDQLTGSLAARARAVAPLVPRGGGVRSHLRCPRARGRLRPLGRARLLGDDVRRVGAVRRRLVLGDGGTLAAAIAAAVLLNTRYAPIGISVAPAMSGPTWKRFLRAQLVVDESWAIGHLGRGRYDMSRILGAGLVLYPSWLLSTLAGASPAT